MPPAGVPFPFTDGLPTALALTRGLPTALTLTRGNPIPFDPIPITCKPALS
jgi:hypothetical protein